MTIEIIRSTQIKAFSCLVQDTRQYLKVSALFQDRNGKRNANIKDANNMSTNNRPDKS
jgi:hypothetical protein